VASPAVNPQAFRSTGLILIESYLSTAGCVGLRAAIAGYRGAHDLPLIHRPERGRSLRYYVIDGHGIRQSLPPLVELYGRVKELARSLTGLDLVPMSNPTANLNVNITPPGGEYRWHYDRNAITALLYLNAVAGGEIEVYPNYRIHLGARSTTCWQRHLDRLLGFPAVRHLSGRHRSIAPKEGLLVIMRGDRTLHSVRPVTGTEERINVVMSFDTREAQSAPLQQLDGYLYSKKPVDAADPNYGRR
jgi:hypothetical protein